jgi:hypothetical protein
VTEYTPRSHKRPRWRIILFSLGVLALVGNLGYTVSEDLLALPCQQGINVAADTFQTEGAAISTDRDTAIVANDFRQLGERFGQNVAIVTCPVSLASKQATLVGAIAYWTSVMDDISRGGEFTRDRLIEAAAVVREALAPFQ